MDLLDSLVKVVEWLTNGIYLFFQEAAVWLISKVAIFWLETQLWGINLAWSIGKGVFEQLQVSAALQSRWNALPGDMASTLYFFKVPDALNVILSAGATKFILRFIPFV